MMVLHFILGASKTLQAHGSFINCSVPITGGLELFYWLKCWVIIPGHGQGELDFRHCGTKISKLIYFMIMLCAFN